MWQYDDEVLDDACDCTLPQSLEGLVCAAWEANCLAKSESEIFYDCKDCLLRKAIQAAQDESVFDYGLGRDDYGNDVLYFDILGRGQVSFHVFWDWDDPIRELIPEYPYEWTEERNDTFDTIPVTPVNAIITVRANGISRGQAHNIFVRAGLDPEFIDNPSLLARCV